METEAAATAPIQEIVKDDGSGTASAGSASAAETDAALNWLLSETNWLDNGKNPAADASPDRVSSPRADFPRNRRRRS